MCITYEVDGALYINITNKCSNNCEFCIRKNGDGAYGSDSLWLLCEPTVSEILESVFAREVLSYREIVFCGYGEPTERIEVLREVALKIKERYPSVKIRVNTNGHSDLINGRDTTDMFCGAVDAISISLNTPSPEKYCEICHPVYQEKAFFALIDFAKRVKSKVSSVQFSVVRETLTESELAECEKIASDAGVLLRVRDYIPAEDK
jgi:TatD family-associated radical SAM protein